MQFTAKMGKALEHYALNRNKSAAYRHAYDTANMSPRTIRQKAWELFRHPLLKQQVDLMNKQAAAAIKVDANWVLQKAMLLAEFNINQFIITDDQGNAIYDFSEATDDDWYCIGEYTVETLVKKDMEGNFYPVEKVKLKGESRLKALEMVAKLTGAQGYNGVKIEHTGSVGVAQISPDEYKAARQEMLDNDDC